MRHDPAPGRIPPRDDTHAMHRGDVTVDGPPGGEDRSPQAIVRGGQRDTSVLVALEVSRTIAVLRAARYERPAAVTGVLAEHGFPVVEFTLTGANALEAIAEAAGTEGSVVGAGSVLSAAEAKDALAAGARFLVSPIRSAEVVSAAGEAPVILAGLTPSELWEAWALTGMPVKVFPASSMGGASYLRSLAGPMPQVPLMPSGGVDATNVGEFLRAGAVAVNVGGSLCSASMLETGDLDEIATRAAILRRAMEQIDS